MIDKIITTIKTQYQNWRKQRALKITRRKLTVFGRDASAKALRIDRKILDSGVTVEDITNELKTMAGSSARGGCKCGCTEFNLRFSNVDRTHVDHFACSNCGEKLTDTPNEKR